MADVTYLQWPFFTDAHRRLQSDLRAWRDERAAAAGRGRRVRGLPGLRRAAGPGRLAALRRPGRLWRRPRVARRPLAVPDSRDARLRLRPGGVRLRHAGPRVGAGVAVRVRAAQAEVPAGGGRRLQRRGVCDLGGRGRVGPRRRCRPPPAATARRSSSTGPRPGSRTPASPPSTWCSAAGPRAASGAFVAVVVDAGTPGLTVGPMIDVMAPHPLGTLTFTDCRVAADQIVGEAGKGLRVALGTLDVFRTSVGAAALGFARRAFDEAVGHVKSRVAFGKPLAEFQMTQASIADMATAIDSAALQVYRAAWTRDQGGGAGHARGGDGQAGGDRVGAAGDRSGGAAARCPRRRRRRRRSSGSIARFAPCASTRARARSRSWSSPGRCCSE